MRHGTPNSSRLQRRCGVRRSRWDRERLDSGSGPFGSPTHAHTGGAWALDLSQDGKEVVTGGNDGIVRVWRAGTWQWQLKECIRRLEQLRANSDEGGRHGIS
ncbi:hypothetical protein [Desulfosarcina cetonica]|uniref:hypothetical protein n=1 Tax=Desulfosarcina cetonica TaxID=90730 RepID=UPI003BEEB53A